MIDSPRPSVTPSTVATPTTRVLRQALGYGWSVAVAADPAIGLPALERWLSDPNPDVRWIVRENLAKARLTRAAPDWVKHAKAALAAALTATGLWPRGHVR